MNPTDGWRGSGGRWRGRGKARGRSRRLSESPASQNTFDPVDSACGSKRQEYVFDKILSVINKNFSFSDKSAARTFFQNLRQAFIDWNYIAWDTDDFKAQEAKIDELLATA